MNKKTIKNIGRTLKKSPVEITLVTLLAIAMIVTGVTPQVSAQIATGDLPNTSNIQLEIAAMQNATNPFGVLPIADDRDPIRELTVPVTAYNSVPWQTDSTPCIGAQGTDICAYLEAGSNTCAANFVPLGTVLEVEDLGICVVRDRMNSRYHYRVDWYMGMDIDGARQFGLRNKNVSIYAS